MNRQTAVKMARTVWGPGVLFILGGRLNIQGVESINRTKPYIIMANHLSYLDIPTLFASVPLNIHFIAKKELKKVPFLGWYMMATGMIFIDRKNTKAAKESLKAAGSLIRKGKTVLIFPEGTTSLTGELIPFKKGGFHLALEAGVDILPVSIKGTNKVWPENNAIKFKRGTIDVNIGSPLSVKEYTTDKESVKQLTAAVFEEIKRLQSLN